MNDEDHSLLSSDDEHSISKDYVGLESLPTHHNHIDDHIHSERSNWRPPVPADLPSDFFENRQGATSSNVTPSNPTSSNQSEEGDPLLSIELEGNHPSDDCRCSFCLV